MIKWSSFIKINWLEKKWHNPPIIIIGEVFPFFFKWSEK
jgi:hypothetical protein